VAGDGIGRLNDKVTSLVFQGEKQIVLNVSELSYVDSAGLGEMISAHGVARKGGSTLKLANLGKRLKDLLVMTKLLNVFEAHDSEEAAVASFPRA
jgi:anti-sigma B factor antagonist